MTSPQNSSCGASSAEFTQQLVRHLPRLRRFVLRKHGATHADDVVQDTLLRALQHAASYDSARDLWPWLQRIAANTSNRSFEREARVPRESLEAEVLSDFSLTLDRSGQAGDPAEGARAMLERLHGHERSAIDGHYLRGLSVAEVAAEENVAVGTIKARLSRARRRLALVAASLATGGLALAWGLLLPEPQASPESGRLLHGSFVIERQIAPEPVLKRVDRSTPTSTGWTVEGGVIVTSANASAHSLNRRRSNR